MQGFEIGRIHPTSLISNQARIEKNVTIGANVIIYDKVEVGKNTFIGPNSIIGEPNNVYYKNEEYVNEPLYIGPNSIIRSSAIIYAGSKIGEGFECGHRVTIREHTTIGRFCRIGTLSDIQGECTIGNYVRFHSSVHIGQKSRIGNYVWIFPYAVLANDPHPPSNFLTGVTVEDFAVIAVKAAIYPGVKIGRDAVVGGMSLVRSDVESESVVAGNPARRVASIHDIRSKFTEKKVYPWREHFDRGMPWEGMGYDNWVILEETNTKND